jgi:hypothetical protein
VAGHPARRARSQSLPQGRQLLVHPCRIVDGLPPGRAACWLAQRSGALSFGAARAKESADRLAQRIETPAAKALALNKSDGVVLASCDRHAMPRVKQGMAQARGIFIPATLSTFQKNAIPVTPFGRGSY